MENRIFLFLLLLSQVYVSAQITMGDISRKSETEKEFIKAPSYESHQNFMDFNEYYGYSYDEDKTPTKKEFYSRYIGLKIFYPQYSNNYNEKSVLIFKDESGINILNRAYVNEKSFKIVKIDEEFVNTFFFDKINDKDKEYLNTEILLTLNDTITNETIYVVESKISFVLVPFYENLNHFFSQTSFIATQDFSADKHPLAKRNGSLYVNKGTEWKGKFSLLRGRDINLFPEDEITNEDEDLKYMAILGNKNDTIIMNITQSNMGRWWFNEVFTPKYKAEEQNKISQTERKEELSKLVKKYGSNYGNLVYNKQGTIGMSKEMCQDIYGITLNKKSYTDAKGEIETWDYTGVLRLYFTNGKLSQIIKY